MQYCTPRYSFLPVWDRSLFFESDRTLSRSRLIIILHVFAGSATMWSLVTPICPSFKASQSRSPSSSPLRPGTRVSMRQIILSDSEDDSSPARNSMMPKKGRIGPPPGKTSQQLKCGSQSRSPYPSRSRSCRHSRSRTPSRSRPRNRGS